jgi:hypothetical protein
VSLSDFRILSDNGCRAKREIFLFLPTWVAFCDSWAVKQEQKPNKIQKSEQPPGSSVKTIDAARRGGVEGKGVP